MDNSIKQYENEGIYSGRYQKNLGAFSQEDLSLILGRSACIVGCGGLGGYVIQTLARFGVGNLTIVDGDVFDVSNLNRQVFCTEDNIGESKAFATEAALASINSQINICARDTLLTEDNAQEILHGHDVVLDCLDNIPTRLLIEETCAKAGIPFVHGAISGFFGQVCSVFPGDNVLHDIYPKNHHDDKETAFGSPPFAPQFVAAVQCSEALKILTGKGLVLRRQLLTIDLLDNSFEVLALN